MISLDFINLAKEILTPLAKKEVINPHELEEALDILRNERKISNKLDKFDCITKKEVCQRLGILRPAVDKLVEDGELIAIKLGNNTKAAIRITVKSFEDYFIRQTIKKA